jgi:hypothetical protein
MSKAYRIESDGSTAPMKRIRTKNEHKELQQILERNPDLLPGEQIDPNDPCQWLVVGREIAVPDPESGTDRWSLDLFFVDHNAKPTLIECKRFQDTRARREVVAQMLDYAANANYYWSKEDLRAAAESTANAQGESLESQLALLTDDEPDQFFQRVEDNLREGQIRMVFFLEEAPWQLRSIVEFLNRQMERSEVLIVEARQYEDAGSRIVVPSLFGYTEEARRVKRTVTVSSQARRKWDMESFSIAATDNLDPQDSPKLMGFIDALEVLGATLAWGTGAINGSVNPKWPTISKRSVLTANTDGSLTLNFKWLNKDDREIAFRDRLIAEIELRTDLRLADDCAEHFPQFSWREWNSSLDTLLDALKQALSEAE